MTLAASDRAIFIALGENREVAFSIEVGYDETVWGWVADVYRVDAVTGQYEEYGELDSIQAETPFNCFAEAVRGLTRRHDDALLAATQLDDEVDDE